MSHRVVLSIGSNCGDRERNVRSAVSWAVGLFYESSVSSIYETEEIHGVGTPYYNAVVRGISEINFEELNHAAKTYEVNNGRDQEARSRGLVPIDIDIVVWDNKIIRPSDYNQNFFKRGYAEICVD